MSAPKPTDLSRLLSKWVVTPDGKRWRVTALLRGVLFGRLDGLECNEFTRIPEPWSLEK